MAWCSAYLPRLEAGETVIMRPRGHSMTGIINSGDAVEISPVRESDILSKGDVVLCKVKGAYYLHLIKSVKPGSYLIGNNRGRTNGWTLRKNIFGKYTGHA